MAGRSGDDGGGGEVSGDDGGGGVDTSGGGNDGGGGELSGDDGGGGVDSSGGGNDGGEIAGCGGGGERSQVMVVCLMAGQVKWE